MSIRKVVLVILLCMGIGAAAALVGVRESRAEQGDRFDTLRTNLNAQGIAVAEVAAGSETNAIRILLPGSADGDLGYAWAETLVDREAAFEMQSGVLPEGSVEIGFVDEKGELLVGTVYQPHPMVRPAPDLGLNNIPPALLASLGEQGQKENVNVVDLRTYGDQYQGTAVEADVIVAGDTSQEQQLRWTTVGLLMELRGFFEKSGDRPPDLYRIDVTNEGGNPVVGYVVDTESGFVRAWVAPGIEPVWSLTRPHSGGSVSGSEAK
ncbi:MAG: hypothetical protein M1274_06935 [Actinobacteria bacterium]|nr:hypothetical protein [Actinomycetota bacterium]